MIPKITNPPLLPLLFTLSFTPSTGVQLLHSIILCWLYYYTSFVSLRIVLVMTQGLTPRRFSGGKYALDNLFGYVSFLLILIFTHLTVNLSYYNNIVRRNLLNFITFSIIFICTFIYNRFRLL